MNEKFLKLTEKLNADEQLVESLFSKETPEEAQALLKDQGFEFTIVEIMELREEITEMALSDEELEGVAGGAEVMGKRDLSSEPWYNKPGQAYINFSHDAGGAIDRTLRMRFRIRKPRRW